MDEASFLIKMKSLNINNIKLHEVLNFIPLHSTNKTPSVCLVFDVMTCSVKNLIDMLRYEDGLDEIIVLHIIKQVAITLEQMRINGYLYTDVRPENILIKTNNDQLDRFCELFDELNWDTKWKEICKEMCKDNNFNLTKKKHKDKFSKMKRELSIKLIKKYNPVLEDLVEDIPRNVQISETMPVYLTDFGSVEKIQKVNNEFTIQSCDYKAPEVLLGLPYTYKVDVWALGCCMYELLTTKCLMQPKKTKHCSLEHNHVYWIVELLGQFPKHMTSRAVTDDNMFFTSGKFRMNDMDKWSLKQSYERDIGEVSHGILELTENMLKIDYKKRFSFQDVIDYIHKLQ